MSLWTAPTVERGIPLTILLVVLTIGQLLGVLVGAVVWQSTVSHNQQGAELPLTVALVGIAGLLACFATWRWRKWGVYLLAAMLVVGAISDLVFAQPTWSLLIKVVLLAALAYLIRVKWTGFR